jgi:hypothetical protein
MLFAVTISCGIAIMKTERERERERESRMIKLLPLRHGMQDSKAIKSDSEGRSE